MQYFLNDRMIIFYGNSNQDYLNPFTDNDDANFLKLKLKLFFTAVSPDYIYKAICQRRPSLNGLFKQNIQQKPLKQIW